MRFKNFIIRTKNEHFTDLGASEKHEMKEFYLVLLKIQKKRPKFDVSLVMKEVYSESVFRKFIFYFYNQ